MPGEAGTGARLDHLVVAARTLDEGRAWLEGRLNVPLDPGGEHETFGTHNLLLSLGIAYLEVIAVNPAAPSPARPRWFALDTPGMQARLADGPALIHWVAALPAPPASPDALALSRGEARWTLTVPADGHLPMDGVAPSLIHWTTDPPTRRLPDRGVRLDHLHLLTPRPDALRRQLDALHFEGEVEVREAPQTELRARLLTPHGPVDL